MRSHKHEGLPKHGARAGAHHHHQHHHRKRHGIARLLPNMFTTLIAPLAVGFALQWVKGCDPPRAVPETALAVARTAQGPATARAALDSPRAGSDHSCP